jgi:ribosomal protein L11 methyltransferase
MPFLQLSLICPAPAEETLEHISELIEALSVTLTDAADAPIFEPQLNTTPLWPQVRVTFLLPAAINREQVRDILRREFNVPGDDMAIVEIADRAWERECLADLKPMRFGERLWVCPLQQTVSAADAVVVYLDPGLAFGTGHHPTTALCLEWLDQALLNNLRVIDFGCGSGILAIAALRLGARQATAVDHDPQALIATQKNAVVNAVDGQLEVLSNSARPAPAEIVLANILAGPLIELAPQIGSLVLPGGQLILSGILREQTAEVLAAYCACFSIESIAERDGWARIHLKSVQVTKPRASARQTPA